MNRSILIVLLLSMGLGFSSRPARAEDAQPWVETMKKVHSRFSGRKGTFAQFGDSITVTQAFWSPLGWGKPKMDVATLQAFDRVKAYIDGECFGWKGDKFGNDSGKTSDWADEHVDKWLKDIDPEVVVIMFGTNDLVHLPIDQYEKHTRSVIEKCEKNGTIVILTTIPPRHEMLEKAKQYAELDRKIAADMKLPLIDFFAEIMKRRPDDWDGAGDKFRNPTNEDNRESLISNDGVHPSYPHKYENDYSEAGLNHSGYVLRTYMTLLTYDQVIKSVLK